MMLGPSGPSVAERWMGRARLSAARDLLARLQRIPQAGPVYVLAADPVDRQDLVGRGARALEAAAAPFHFGRALASTVAREGFRDVAYFGGASAPLAGEAFLEQAFEKARDGLVVANNLHSTDWAIVPQAETLVGLAESLPTDNALGWVLAHEAGRRVDGLPPTAASRADLDTPSDVVLTSGHADLGPALQQVRPDIPDSLQTALDRLRGVLTTPGRTVTLIGRASAGVWQALEGRGQVWARVFAEERGMLASGRAQRGEVRSLIAAIVDELGPGAFLDRLASMTDAVFWDTRVWMSQRGPWPSAADRFAADLGSVEAVGDPALRALTGAVAASPVPVLTGGHGVVAGGLLALLESLESETVTSPG
jgi:hypothetical protein